MLGWKHLVPGSGQWYESSHSVVSNTNHHKNKCWICEGHIFSVIFWSPKYAFRLKPIFSSIRGKGKEAEQIKFEIEKFPHGLIEVKKPIPAKDQQSLDFPVKNRS
jgi:hypothetical protein